MCLLERLSEVHIHAPPGWTLQTAFQHLWVSVSYLNWETSSTPPKTLKMGEFYWPKIDLLGHLEAQRDQWSCPGPVLVNGTLELGGIPATPCWRSTSLESDRQQAFEWILYAFPTQSTFGHLKEIKVSVSLPSLQRNCALIYLSEL